MAVVTHVGEPAIQMGASLSVFGSHYNLHKRRMGLQAPKA